MQGAFNAHAKVVERLGCPTREVRTPDELEGVSGLILPGGESTTIEKLIGKDGLDTAIKERCLEDGLLLFGTCMGMIVLAREIEGSDQFRMGMADIAVRRNAYGRQRESFEAEIPLNGVAGGERGGPVVGVFIRAPLITRVGPVVDVLAAYNDSPVLVRDKNVLCCTFHPELTDDSRIHEYFLKMVRE